MSELPKIYVSLERKINLGNYEHVNVTVGLSNIPATANEALIDLMLTGPAAYAFEKLKSELETRGYELMSQYARPDGSDVPEGPKLSEAAFLEHVAHEHQHDEGEPDEASTMTPEEQAEFDAVREAMYMERAAGIIEQIETPDVTSWPEPIALPPAGAPLAALMAVPTESEVATHAHAFGVRVEIPPAEWFDAPITDTNADFTSGGQLKAVNTALGCAGFGGPLRFPVCMAILDQFGYALEVTSTRDLTKAHAHLILSFFEQATPRVLAQLEYLK